MFTIFFPSVACGVIGYYANLIKFEEYSEGKNAAIGTVIGFAIGLLIF